MKKFLFALMALAIVSCGKQNTEPEPEIEPEPEPPKAAYYSFRVTDNVFVDLSQSIGPITTTIYLSEYKGKQKVAVNQVVDPVVGRKYKFKAKSVAEYVTVYAVTERKSDGKQASTYMANAFYLEPGEIVYIDLSKDSSSSQKEPIAD